MNDQNNPTLWGRVTGWLKHPFNSDGSALNWTLFVGLFLVILWFWSHVLLMITDDV